MSCIFSQIYTELIIVLLFLNANAYTNDHTNFEGNIQKLHDDRVLRKSIKLSFGMKHQPSLCCEPTRRRKMPLKSNISGADEQQTQLSLEEELDALDDIIMGRNPNEGRDKVKVFGAWLDADIAGRKTGDNRKIKKKLAEGKKISKEEQGEIFFEEAVKYMKVGKYENSVALINRALDYSGKDTTRGGGFQLWLAQAMYATGKRMEAKELLRGLKTHMDMNIRTVAIELLYIYEAPEIGLNENDFVEFPDMSEITERFDEKAFRLGELNRPRYSTYKEKPPVYYDFSQKRVVHKPDLASNITSAIVFILFTIAYFLTVLQ